jgi:hypothetical protein
MKSKLRLIMVSLAAVCLVGCNKSLKPCTGEAAPGIVFSPRLGEEWKIVEFNLENPLVMEGQTPYVVFVVPESVSGFSPHETGYLPDYENEAFVDIKSTAGKQISAILKNQLKQPPYNLDIERTWYSIVTPLSQPEKSRLYRAGITTLGIEAEAQRKAYIFIIALGKGCYELTGTSMR